MDYSDSVFFLYVALSQSSRQARERHRESTIVRDLSSRRLLELLERARNSRRLMKVSAAMSTIPARESTRPATALRGKSTMSALGRGELRARRRDSETTDRRRESAGRLR